VNESWKPAPGYEGLAEVSSAGLVRSIPHIDHRGRPWPGKLLKPYVTGKNRNYMAVSLAGHNVKVHRLVAMAFLPPDDEKDQVNHKNGNTQDNRAENLEWCTASQNVRHAFDVLGKKSSGGHSGKTGAKHHSAKAIVATLPDGTSKRFGGAAEAARALGLQAASVVRTANGLYAHTKQHRFQWACTAGTAA